MKNDTTDEDPSCDVCTASLDICDICGDVFCPACSVTSEEVCDGCCEEDFLE